MANGSALTIESLFRIGRVRASGAIPDEGRQSLPIPVRAPAAIHVLFFFCPTQLSPREGARIAPPNYLERIDAATGSLIELRAVEPSDFGLRDAPNEPIGAIRLDDDMTPERYLELRTALFGLYDRLLPHFAAGRAQLGDESRNDAREFQAIFARLREAPLAEYYTAIGAEFFGWLATVSR